MDRGLDMDGCIRRGGALDRVPAAFADVVAGLRFAVLGTFGSRLDGLYLYGSIPRGTAVEGRSDLDAVVLVPGEPTAADTAAVREIERSLDAAHPQIDGAGILVLSRELILSPAERYDGGFFLACLCTPLVGADVARELPRYPPSVELARDTNGDVAAVLAELRAGLADADPAEARRICRRAARRTLRAAFCLVMPCWQGWESDLDRVAAIVADYYPDWAADLRWAVALAREATADRSEIAALLDFGDRLAVEFAARIGVRTR